MDLNRVQEQLREFAKVRGWESSHNPKNLSMALVCEAAELMEIFQWLSGEDALRVRERSDLLAAARDEVADVAIYLFRIADVLGIDMEKAVEAKLAKNASKYPSDSPHQWKV